MSFRRKPAGVVRGPITEGVLDLHEDCSRSASVSGGPFKFTLTSPYMLARTLLDHHYEDFEALTLAIADVLAAQVAELPCACIQVDEANIPGSPGRRADRAQGDQPHSRPGESAKRPFIFVSATTAARPFRKADGMSCSPSSTACTPIISCWNSPTVPKATSTPLPESTRKSSSASASSTSRSTMSRPTMKSPPASTVPRKKRAGTNRLGPSRLRILDAQALRRRPQNRGVGPRTR